jgi:hypothetical protein
MNKTIIKHICQYSDLNTGVKPNLKISYILNIIYLREEQYPVHKGKKGKVVPVL